MSDPAPQYDPSTTFNTFYDLLRDLDGFAAVAQVELIFNRDRQAFLQGEGFKEPITANLQLHREIRQQMREILLKHLS